MHIAKLFKTTRFIRIAIFPKIGLSKLQNPSTPCIKSNKFSLHCMSHIYTLFAFVHNSIAFATELDLDYLERRGGNTITYEGAEGSSKEEDSPADTLDRVKVVFLGAPGVGKTSIIRVKSFHNMIVSITFVHFAWKYFLSCLWINFSDIKRAVSYVIELCHRISTNLINVFVLI